MKIFFSGIGGVGIGPLAEIARDAGYDVVGSDLVGGLVTDELIERGLRVTIGLQDGVFLQKTHDESPIDLFIHTSALTTDHPELVLAQRLGVPTGKRDDLLARIITDKKLKLIAVSGTHGKTTTTGMLVWVCKQLGLPISYSIGTTISFGPSGAFDPNSEYFVYECDEFDRNFLHFKPYVSLITSVDYDHTDTYASQQEYTSAFNTFIGLSEAVIVWQQDADFLHNNSEHVLRIQDSEVARIDIAGEHNRRNGTLVLKVLEKLHIGNLSDNTNALHSFPGTDRRFEKLADNLYSDYGHHPIEIAATLQLAREISDHVVLVYQPHQNIRQHELLGAYTDQFELAEVVYWLPTYLSREDPALDILPPEQLIETVRNKDRVHVAAFDDTLWGNIQKARSEGMLVLCMGAGVIDEWVRAKLYE